MARRKIVTLPELERPRAPGARERAALLRLCPVCGTSRDLASGAVAGVYDGHMWCPTCNRRTSDGATR